MSAKKYKNIVISIILFIFFPTLNKHIACDASPRSQLGDRLLLYGIAKWVCWKYKLPFIYQPFLYSDLFVLHEKEYFNESLLKTYGQNKIKLQRFSQDSFNEEALYMVALNFSYDMAWNDYRNLIDQITITQGHKHFLTEGRQPGGYFDYLFIATRKNPNFLAELRTLIFPKQKITYLNLPKDKISVAIHIRCGGKFEKYQHYFSSISLKMAPLDFYIDQLKRLSTLLGNAPLFVYIFTNHSEPLVLVEEMKNNLKQFNNITFASRNKNNQENTFIEDLFLMSKFDCLIRPWSSFSMIAQLVGNHKIIIYPKRGFFQNEKLYIDKIGMMMIDQNFNFVTTHNNIQSFIQKLMAQKIILTQRTNGF